MGYNCPFCDTALSRLASFRLATRNVVKAHHLAQHAPTYGRPWFSCEQSPCPEMRELLDVDQSPAATKA